MVFAIRIRNCFIEVDPDPVPADQNETGPNGSGSATLHIAHRLRISLPSDPLYIILPVVVRIQDLLLALHIQDASFDMTHDYI